MDDFQWSCPYCGRDTTIVVRTNLDAGDTFLATKNEDGPRCCTTTFIVCPNPKCQKFVLTIDLSTAKYNRMTSDWVADDHLQSWRLSHSRDRGDAADARGRSARQSETGAPHLPRPLQGLPRGAGLFGRLHGMYWWDMQAHGDVRRGEIRKEYAVNASPPDPIEE